MHRCGAAGAEIDHGGGERGERPREEAEQQEAERDDRERRALHDDPEDRPREEVDAAALRGIHGIEAVAGDGRRCGGSADRGDQERKSGEGADEERHQVERCTEPAADSGTEQEAPARAHCAERGGDAHRRNPGEHQRVPAFHGERESVLRTQQAAAGELQRLHASKRAGADGKHHHEPCAERTCEDGVTHEARDRHIDDDRAEAGGDRADVERDDAIDDGGTCIGLGGSERLEAAERRERQRAARGGAGAIGFGVVAEFVGALRERGGEVRGGNARALEVTLRDKLRGEATQRALRVGLLEIVPGLREESGRIDGGADRGVPRKAGHPEKKRDDEAHDQSRRLAGGGQSPRDPGDA